MTTWSNAGGGQDPRPAPSEFGGLSRLGLGALSVVKPEPEYGVGRPLAPELRDAPPPSVKTSATTPPAAKPGWLGSNQGLATMGFLTAIGGALTSAIGAYYQANTARFQAKSAALDAEFAGGMAAIEAREAADNATLEIEAGHQEAARVTAQYGRLLAQQRVSAAVRGVAVNSGSAANVQASTEFEKRQDVVVINQNTARAVSAALRDRTNALTRQRFASVNASNLRESAKSIRPWAAAAGQSMQSLGSLAADVANFRRGPAYSWSRS